MVARNGGKPPHSCDSDIKSGVPGNGEELHLLYGPVEILTV